MNSELRLMAETAFSMVLKDPVLAKQRAEATLAKASIAEDYAAASIAERVLGLAARELGHLDRAVTHIKRSVQIADRHGLTELAVHSRVEMTWMLAYRGDTVAALAQVDALASVAKGQAAARLEIAHAHVLSLLGRLDEAVQCNRRALAILRKGSDPFWEAVCLNNRGLVYAQLGNLKRAESDLKAAEQIHEQLGNSLGVADVWWNRGLVAFRYGDLPAALQLYARADERYVTQGTPKPHLLFDRCELYLSARLIPEARQTALKAIEQLSRRPLELADATLMLSHAALLGGDAATAKTMALRAERSFAKQRRPGWLALSRYAQVRARWMAGDWTASSLAQALATADELAASGWVGPAMDARVVASRTAMRLGLMEVARQELSRASRARDRGTVEERTRAWHAMALLRVSEGNRQGAYAAIRAGMKILDQHRASLGATELRAHASGHGGELAELGLHLTLDKRDARGAFGWMERWRAGALRLSPVRPPADSKQAAECAELRGITYELDAAGPAGQLSADLPARQAQLETSIRERQWTIGGTREHSFAEIDPARLIDALGDRALVELAESQGTLWCIVIAGRRISLHQLGAATQVQREVEALRFAGRRMAWGGPGKALEAAKRSWNYSSERLEQMLVKPVLHRIREREMVIVPTGALHALPWSVLPSLAGRPISVAPSAATWLKAEALPPPGNLDRVVLVAGPGLSGAGAEVEALRKLYPRAQTLTGPRAQVETVLGHLDGAGLAHLAMHARFRGDNPLFSSLHLSDGHLMAYDLEGLSKTPTMVVLSACESGLSGVSPGDELMGLAACLFSLGTRTLIASVMPVPDEDTQILMIKFHEELDRTSSAASALAVAQTSLRLSREPKAAAGAGFLCLGAG